MSRFFLSTLMILTLAVIGLSADFAGTLAQVAKYDYGDSRESLTTLSELLRQASGTPKLAEYEKAMLVTLQAPDTKFAAKQYLCKELSIMGTAASAPALGKMLYTPQTADIARYALERIPGREVDAVLLKAAGKTRGLVQIGVINTVGERRIAGSEKVLGKLLKAKDPQAAAAAATALGKLGNSISADLLRKSLAGSAVRSAVVDAYLYNADLLLKSGNKAEAETAYRLMFAAQEALPTRTAALTGLVRTVADPTALIINVLRNEPPALQAVAAGLVHQCRRSMDLSAIAAELPGLAPQTQIQLLTAFRIKGDPSVRPAVAAAVGADDPQVSAAAVAALAAVGTAEDVTRLAQLTAEGNDVVKSAAKEALARLNAEGVDEAILAGLTTAAGATQVALVEAIGDRNMSSSAPQLLNMADSENRRARVAALKALGQIAVPADLPALINVLVTVDGDAERREAERAVVAVSRKIEDPSQQGDAVIAALPTATTPAAKSSLMLVMGRIGDPDALPILQAALKDKNLEQQRAAVLALSEWPTPEPINDLLNAAKTLKDETMRVLALRGYITLAGVAGERPKSETTALYKTALDLAQNVSEKRLALSGLGKVYGPEAFDLAAHYLDDPEIGAEAELAVIENAMRLYDKNDRTDARKEIMRKIGERTEDERIKRAVFQFLQ